MSPALVDSIFLATFGAYVGSSVFFLVFLVSDRFAFAGKLAPRLLFAAVLLHATHITVSAYLLHVCPVEGIHFALSVAALFACVSFLVLRRWYRIDVVGAFVAPLALTFLLASQLAAAAPPDPQYRRAILPIHVAVNLLGFGLFMLAFTSAVAYLMLDKRLKEKRVDGLFRRLPPLDALDRAEHVCLLAGFPLLTLGIVTGTYWAREVEAGSAIDVARAVFGYATWLFFAAVLLLRAAAGWRGRRAAYGTIAGFGFAVLVMVVYLLKQAPHAAVASL